MRRLTGRGHAIRRSAVLLCVLTTPLLAACGESEQQKAEHDVCTAKTEVAAGVENLAGQTLDTLSIAELEADAKKVKTGLQKLTDAQGKLSEPRRAQLEQATSSLSSDLQELKDSLKSLSAAEVKAKLSAAAQRLLDGYTQALAPVKC